MEKCITRREKKLKSRSVWGDIYYVKGKCLLTYSLIGCLPGVVAARPRPPHGPLERSGLQYGVSSRPDG